jgi:hypothetical protein
MTHHHIIQLHTQALDTPVRIVQRADGLLLALHSGGHCGDDTRLCAATQAITQQACELGVTVGHVAAVLHEGSDHSAQRQEGLINGARFTCTPVLGSGPMCL